MKEFRLIKKRVRLYDGLDRAILELLRERSRRTNDISRLLHRKWSHPTVIKHLGWLRENGLVEAVRDPTHPQAMINVIIEPMPGFLDGIRVLEARASDLARSGMDPREHFERLMKDVVMPSMRFMCAIVTPKVGLRKAGVAGLHWVNWLVDDIQSDVRRLVGSGLINGQDLLRELEKGDPELWKAISPASRGIVSPAPTNRGP